MDDNRTLKNLGICQIKKYVTNRYPFLLIDKAEEVIPGSSAAGYKNVTVNEGYFQGHFPGSPLMPGMIQMEVLFQMLTLTVLTMDGNEGKTVRAVAAKNIRLKERVVPGSRLDIETRLVEWDGVKGRGNVRGLINGKEACSAEFEFVMPDQGMDNGGRTYG